MNCIICKKETKEVDKAGACFNCWYANALLKRMGVKGYYDGWHSLKTVDGVEYE